MNNTLYYKNKNRLSVNIYLGVNCIAKPEFC